MPNITLITDSNSDLPAIWAAQYNVKVVPSLLILEGQEYRDNVDITREEFYARLPHLKKPPTTATPGAGDFEKLYRACGDVDIISIHVAAKLSGFYNAARVGAENSGARVTLIDSEQLTMGFGWQVLAAAEAIAAGKTVPEVVEAVTHTRQRVKVFAMLDTLEYLRRSGRASGFMAVMGNLLQFKPMLELKAGEVLPLARPRTRSKATEKLLETVVALGPLERLAILYTTTPADAQTHADQHAAHSATPPVLVNITSVIGTHIGPGAVGVAAVRAEKV